MKTSDFECGELTCNVSSLARIVFFPLVFFAFCVVLSTAAPGASSDPPQAPELARAQSVYLDQRLIIHDATKRKHDAVTQEYRAHLDMLERQSLDKGDLQLVLAVRSEKNRMAPKADTKVDTAQTLPEIVKKLRDEYEARIKAVALEDTKSVHGLLERYIGYLDNLKRELTRQDRIEEALQVEQKLVAIRAELKIAEQGFDNEARPPQMQDVSAPDKAADLERRLAEIRIGSFTIYVSSASSASSPINALVNALHPHGISVNVDREALPIQSMHKLSDGRVQYYFQSNNMDTDAILKRHFNLSDISALDALRLICDVFSIGYYLDANSIVIVSARDPRAIWVRLSYTAESMSALFAENQTRAMDSLRSKQVRITGPITGITRSLSGRLTVQLLAPRPVWIELSADNDPTEIKKLETEFQQLQNSAMRRPRTTSIHTQPGTIRRIGDPDSAPQQSNVPALMITLLAEYRTQVGLTIHFKDGKDIAWQQRYISANR